MTWDCISLTEAGTETPFFFGAPGLRKFAVLHQPRPGLALRSPIVVCHPHFEEKLWAHRVLVDLAREACRRGHAVLRFDFSGHGDSDGAFEDFGFADLEHDLDEAIDLVAARLGANPVLFGLRLGGTFAGRAAAKRGLRTVLWEPVVDTEAWLRDCLRMNLAFQVRLHGRVRRTREDLVKGLLDGESVLIEGYGLTGRFWNEATAAGGLGPGSFPGNCPDALVVEIRKAWGPNESPLQSAARSWGQSARVAYRRVTDEPFWSDVRRYRVRSSEALAHTLDWLEGGRRPAP